MSAIVELTGGRTCYFVSFVIGLGHLNRQTKIAENSKIHFVWKPAPKEVFVESFKFFDPPNIKSRLFKFFAKLNEKHILMANLSKLCKYQIFALIELHNLSKGQLADRIFKLWKICVFNSRVVKHILIFLILKRLLSKLWRKNLQVPKYILKVLTKFYCLTNIYDLRFLGNETTAFWIYFKTCTEN